jgi:hypothetical protein
MNIAEQNRIQQILDELAELGKKHYLPEYQDSIPYFQRVGAAITSVSDDVKGAFELAYEVAEDWNYHRLCSALSWIYPDLEGQDKMNKKYSNELDALVNAVKRDNVEVLMVNEPLGGGEYRIRHAYVTVNVEWLD